ncbi:TPA: hypothetical protein UM343_001166 [Stenotrophomonas maltophilia]|nr:hypothetical protein [Stenotrophomonas maltophilia]
MWMKIVGQRELIEVFVAAKRVSAQRVWPHERFPVISEEMAALFWMDDPELVQSNPFLILVPPSRLKRVHALVESMPGRPFPCSAHIRIADSTNYNELSSERRRVRSVVQAIAGLIVSELACAQSNLPVADLSLAGLVNSFAFTFGRILNSVPLISFNSCVSIEKDVRDKLGDSRSGWLATSERENFEMLSVAYQLAADKITTDIGAFCAALINGKEPSDAIWLKISSKIGWNVPISQISRMNREDRLGCFAELNKFSDLSMQKEFCAAYLATLISPGTFDHLEMVKGRSSRGTVSWYGLLAGLQRNGAALRGLSGVGQRIMRELLVVEEVFKPTSADVSATELLGMSSEERRRLWALSLTPDELKVEIYSGLVLPYFREVFNPGSRSDPISNGGRGQLDLLPTALKDDSGRDERIEDNLSKIVSLLKEVVELVPAKPKARSRAKPKK